MPQKFFLLIKVTSTLLNSLVRSQIPIHSNLPRSTTSPHFPFPELNMSQASNNSSPVKNESILWTSSLNLLHPSYDPTTIQQVEFNHKWLYSKDSIYHRNDISSSPIQDVLNPIFYNKNLQQWYSIPQTYIWVCSQSPSYPAITTPLYTNILQEPFDEYKAFYLHYISAQNTYMKISLPFSLWIGLGLVIRPWQLQCCQWVRSLMQCYWNDRNGYIQII